MAFFQKVRFVFQISQSSKKIIPKNYPELEIWISCLLIWAGISNFKLRIVFWNNFFGRLGDLKNESHFLNKRHLYQYPQIVCTFAWNATIFLRQRKENIICTYWTKMLYSLCFLAVELYTKKKWQSISFFSDSKIT